MRRRRRGRLADDDRHPPDGLRHAAGRDHRRGRRAPAAGQSGGSDREATGEGDVYEVRPGDALPLIASRYDITVEELVDFNNWEDGASIRSIPATRCASRTFADDPER